VKGAAWGRLLLELFLDLIAPRINEGERFPPPVQIEAPTREIDAMCACPPSRLPPHPSATAPAQLTTAPSTAADRQLQAAKGLLIQNMTLT
jgi:hypothetical protein